MIGYTIRRILIAIPTLLIVLTITFVLIRIAPGDPAEVRLGDYASKEAVEALRAEMGLNKPIWVQYLDALKGLVQGDFGRSMVNGRPISRDLTRSLPYTLELTLAGIIFGALLGIPTGVYTALKRNTLADYIGRTLSLGGLSFPTFYLGILLMLLFAIKIPIFPVVGGGDLDNLAKNLYHLFLPGLTLGLIMTAYVTRMTRSSVLNILNEDYVRTARAKGLAERKVIYKHLLRNALLPITALIGVYAIVLIGGSVMVEIVFSRPGLGRMMIGALKQRDYTTLQAVMITFTSFVVLINLLTDLMYGFIDPRVRLK
ncbi:MAG: ABC transporter permease [Thermodesulfobacteriota bacterium]|jgi:ABC-type dipeptide/oligopeptide/nickel transport system permease component